MQFALHFQNHGSVHTRVKSAEHGKIFKTTSVTNLNTFSNNFLKSKVNDTFLMT